MLVVLVPAVLKWRQQGHKTLLALNLSVLLAGQGCLVFALCQSCYKI